MIGQTISHYRILEKLGEGGMGVVYKAEDSQLRRIVALKFLSPFLVGGQDSRQRFVHEAQALASISHPNIATIFEIGELGAEIFIALEYIEGQSLAEMLKSGPLGVRQAIDIAIQMSEGLRAAHERGVVHRDIKSDNVMLTPQGQVKILDFGLAKLRGVSAVTKAGATLGTMGYMSPEQLRGEAIDRRTDIWALGIVLFEMTIGRKPFHADYEEAVAYQVLNESPEPLTDLRTEIPMELEGVVTKALQKEPAARYQCIDELLVDLRAIQVDDASGKSRRPSSQRRRAFSKQRIYRYGIVALVCLLLIAGGLYLFQSGREEKTESIVSDEQNALSSVFRQPYSIAVLPFKNISSDREQDYFCDGMTEQVISTMSTIQDLKVIARTSVMQFRNSDKSIPDIGKQLGVANLLEGSIRKSGNRIRVTVRLIKADDGFHLWAKDYDYEIRDVFTIQDDVAKAIVAALKIKLSDEQRIAITKRYTENTEAYQLYLRGRFEWNKRTERAMRSAIGFFEKAIELDPGYSLAYSGVADAYEMLGNHAYLRTEDAYPKARAAALKALELDDRISEAYTSLGRIRCIYELDWSGAEEAFKRAIALNPSYPEAHQQYSNFLLTFLRFDEALIEAHRAQQLDPFSVPIAIGVGLTYTHARQYDRAIEVLKRIAELDPNATSMYLELGIAYRGKKMFPEAIANLQRAVAGPSRTGTDPLAMLGYVYGEAGQRQNAQNVLEQLQRESRQRYVQPTAFALLYTGLGDYDRAITWLERAYREERSVYLTHLNVEPTWDPLRSDQRFIALLEKMGLKK